MGTRQFQVHKWGEIYHVNVVKIILVSKFFPLNTYMLQSNRNRTDITADN
jgi:hypothetical protein